MSPARKRLLRNSNSSGLNRKMLCSGFWSTTTNDKSVEFRNSLFFVKGGTTRVNRKIPANSCRCNYNKPSHLQSIYLYA